MFWKRRKTDTALLYVDSDEKRSAFRVSPHPNLPADITVDGRFTGIIDIAAGGVSFRNIDFREGGLHQAVLKLAGYGPDISAEICIISIGPDDICHCRFKTIREEDVDAIHKYVLEVQKEQIREKRQLRLNTDTARAPGNE